VARPSFRTTFDVVATLAATISAVVLIWTALRGPTHVSAARQPPSLPTSPVSLSPGWPFGSEKAAVVLFEYSEFQCPYCARFAKETWPLLKSEYVDTGRVLFIFKQFPLSSAHPFALPAARAADCAGQQGHFWEMHDLLFQRQGSVLAGDLPSLATVLGIDPKLYATCLQTSQFEDVAREIDEGRRLGVDATPAFMAGTQDGSGRVHILKRIQGAQPLQVFQTSLDQLLASLSKH
jgi:protein-disulfide isomerase